MKPRKVLFIDDQDISSNFSRIRRALSKEGYLFQPTFVHVSEPTFQKTTEEGHRVIDPHALKKYFQENFFETTFDIVACDVDFSDTYNGFELLTWLYNSVNNTPKQKLRRAKFVFYTSNKQTLFNIASNEVEKLLRIKLEALVDRQNLVTEIARLVYKLDNEIDLVREFQSVLTPHQEKTFKGVYPVFNNKTIGEILHEIEVDSHHGIKFQKSLIEQALLHMIELQST